MNIDKVLEDSKEIFGLENQLSAVKENGYAIQYINSPSENVCLEAVKENGYAIQYINSPSENICLESVKQNGNLIRHINSPSENVCLESVKQNGYAIIYINSPSENVMIEALKQNKNCIQFFKKAWLTPFAELKNNKLIKILEGIELYNSIRKKEYPEELLNKLYNLCISDSQSKIDQINLLIIES